MERLLDDLTRSRRDWRGSRGLCQCRATGRGASSRALLQARRRATSSHRVSLSRLAGPRSLLPKSLGGPTLWAVRFVKESVFAASAATLFAFHERPDAFARLQPPWQISEIVQPPTSLRVGTRVVIRVRLGPVWQTIEAEHVAYEPGRMFADRMLRGPFASWLHRHIVTPEGPDRSRLTDEIRLRATVRGSGARHRRAAGPQAARTPLRVPARGDAGGRGGSDGGSGHDVGQPAAVAPNARGRYAWARETLLHRCPLDAPCLRPPRRGRRIRRVRQQQQRLTGQGKRRRRGRRHRRQRPARDGRRYRRRPRRCRGRRRVPRLHGRRSADREESGDRARQARHRHRHLARAGHQRHDVGDVRRLHRRVELLDRHHVRVRRGPRDRRSRQPCAHDAAPAGHAVVHGSPGVRRDGTSAAGDRRRRARGWSRRRRTRSGVARAHARRQRARPDDLRAATSRRRRA